MDFNTTIDIIIKDLNEAREIIDDLKKYPGVPILHIELAKLKCKNAGEVIALLKNQSGSMPVETTAPLSLKTPSAVVTPTPSEKPSQVEVPAHVEIHKESEKIPEAVSESSILADKFSNPSNRFKEQSATVKNDDDISGLLKSKPLTSLSQAIGVNDKFLFIREIFKGNKDAYAQAISRLDSAENLTDARAVITSYTGNITESEAVKQLLSLVRRKLSFNE